MPVGYPSPGNGYGCAVAFFHQASKLSATKPFFNVDNFEAEITAYFKGKLTCSKEEIESLIEVRLAIFSCTEDNAQQNIEKLKDCLKQCVSKFKNTDIGRIYEKAFSSLMAGAFIPVKRATKMCGLSQ